jgi:hypothetical protein
MAGMGVDPFTMGLLSMFAGSNPEQAAPLLTQMGVPVPKMPESLDQGLGAPTQPGLPQPAAQIPGSTMGSSMAPAAPGELPWAPGGGAGQAPGRGAPGQAPGQSPLSALAGVKAPAPLQPVMSGGVAGGVKPPDVTAATKVGSPAIDALMAALLGGGGGPRVPTLGEYIRGGKY